MSRYLTRTALIALALSASVPAIASQIPSQQATTQQVPVQQVSVQQGFASQGQDASAWKGGYDTYRNNLTRCIARTGACDRGLLSKDDRDYLTYEMKDQRFDRLTATQVVDVRMEYYGREVPVIRGHSTGIRYTSSEPTTGAAPQPSGNGGIIGMMTPENVQAVGGVLAKGLGAVMNGANG